MLQNDPDLQNAFKGIVRTYWLVEVEGVETDTDSVQTDNDDVPHERHAGEAKLNRLYTNTKCSFILKAIVYKNNCIFLILCNRSKVYTCTSEKLEYNPIQI